MTLKPIIYRIARRTKNLQYWVIAKLVFSALALIRLVPAKWALGFVDSSARILGPFMGRHRTAINNLHHAFPDKTREELSAIAGDMWGNMARLAVEYVFLDEIARINPEFPDQGTVDVHGVELFEKIRASEKPRIFFTAHMGNFELLPICAAMYGLQISALFRPPNNPYIAERVAAARELGSGTMVPSKVGASIALARILEASGNVGVLVDQKFPGGIKTTFFGRSCESNPLVPKLARQFDCDVHPVFCRRTPGNRFRIDILEKLDLPRAKDGRIDTGQTAQLINDVVEDWVRRDPGQWTWFHKRWQTGSKRKIPLKPGASAIR